MNQKGHRKTLTKWVACAMALAFACVLCGGALAQITSASTPAAHPKSKTAVAHTGRSKTASSRKHGKHRTTARGQQKIDPQRAKAIQEALIREHYLGSATAGTWNQASEDAMRHYQSDHGWQSKTVPDSRALISLGLGPSRDHLLNPESAMTTGPETPRAASLTPVSQNPAPRNNASPPASHSPDPGTPMNTNSAPSPTTRTDPSSPQ